MDREPFTLTPELVKLLQHSYVRDRLSDCEYGAAELDCKRPYGNSDVELDIIELLNWNDSPQDRKRAKELHEKTPQALQVVLHTASFEPGVCVWNRDEWKWERQS